MPFTTSTRSWWVACTVAATVALAGCGTGLSLRDAVQPGSPHERYARSIRHSRAIDAALAEQWMVAAERALLAPVGTVLPFAEVFHLPPAQPSAVAYRVELRRGQRFTVDVTRGEEGPGLFADAYLLRASDDPQRVASAGPAATGLTFDAPRDGSYLVRLQPELRQGGRYEVAAHVTASMVFPVAGADGRAIGSLFGVSRDGGLREHHGIDIFATRGTPVLSATDGRVTRVETTGRGGHVVWVWDAERRASLYYAHLDEQRVSPGQRVYAGDEIGTVGNTGNARGTPPHLHFGIYRRGDGPVDPHPYVHAPRTQARAVTANLAPLGTWHRTGGTTYRLRAGASTSAAILADLSHHTLVHVEGAVADWYRVALPDGTRGFITARGIEPLDDMRPHRTTTPAVVRKGPAEDALVLTRLPADVEIPVIGSHAEYRLVRTPDGHEGWALLE